MNPASSNQCLSPAAAELSRYAVIGDPVEHSLSPVMMNAAFTSLRVSAIYEKIRVVKAEVELPKLHQAGYCGLSVTLPHKESAFQLAVKTDETARAIGAVNTLRRMDEQGGWEGINTDWLGAVRALEQAASLKDREAVVIGAGGAARAAVYGLLRAGARVTVVNRTPSRGEALAGHFGCPFVPLADLAQTLHNRAFDVAVQCTSAGLMGSKAELVLPQVFFHPRMVVLETVYRPVWTPFALAAREAGCQVVPGLEMLLHQGVAQLEWWLCRQDESIPPEKGIDIMRDALKKAMDHA